MNMMYVWMMGMMTMTMMTKMVMMMNDGKKSMTKEKMGPMNLHVSVFILAEKVLMAGIVLKGGYCNYPNSLIGPVGYNNIINIWFENRRNKLFRPKKWCKKQKVKAKSGRTDLFHPFCLHK